MDSQTKIGLGAAAASAALTVAFVMWPQAPREALWALLIFFAAITIWGFWPLIRSFVLFPRHLIDIPMREAALKLYEAVENQFVGRFAHRMGENEDETLGYFFHAMVMDGVPIYGRKPPSTVLREIPQDELKNLYPLTTMESASFPASAGKVAYTSLTIKRWDLLREMKVLRRRSAEMSV